MAGLVRVQFFVLAMLVSYCNQVGKENGGRLITDIKKQVMWRYNPKLWMGGMREAAYPSA
jgi:hypothetical protein